MFVCSPIGWRRRWKDAVPWERETERMARRAGWGTDASGKKKLACCVEEKVRLMNKKQPGVGGSQSYFTWGTMGNAEQMLDDCK